MGCQPTLPGEFLEVPEPPNAVFLQTIRQSALQSPRPVLHNRTGLPESLPESLLSAETVLVRRDGVTTPLSPRYDGPYRVLRRSLRVFELQIGDKTEKVSTLRLKAANAEANAGVAQPPRRGRPPNASPPPVQVIPETYKTPAGEKTPYQKTVIVNGIPPSAVQQTRARPREKTTVPVQMASERAKPRETTRPTTVPTRAQTREKTTPTLGRGRHHVKNRPGGFIPALSEPVLAPPEIGRRRGKAKVVRFSLKAYIIPSEFFPDQPLESVPQTGPIPESGRPVRSRQPPDRLGFS